MKCKYAQKSKLEGINGLTLWSDMTFDVASGVGVHPRLRTHNAQPRAHHRLGKRRADFSFTIQYSISVITSIFADFVRFVESWCFQKISLYVSVSDRFPLSPVTHFHFNRCYLVLLHDAFVQFWNLHFCSGRYERFEENLQDIATYGLGNRQ